MCVISINIQTENDLYFAITNTILSINLESFTVSDVMKELKSNNITEETVEVARGRLKKSVEVCIQNLIEHGKVIEEPRTYILADK